MKTKHILKLFLILWCIFSLTHFSYIPSYSSNGESDGYYYESIKDQGINLTIAVNNRYLTWDSNLIINITVLDIANNFVPSSKIFLKLSTVSYIYIYYNISIPYIILSENITIINGSKSMEVPIQHIPTQQSYTLTAIFINETQIGPNISYSLFISSVRSGIITFDLFFLGYIGLLIVFGILFVLFKRGIIKIKPKKQENIQDLKRKKIKD